MRPEDVVFRAVKNRFDRALSAVLGAWCVVHALVALQTGPHWSVAIDALGAGLTFSLLRPGIAVNADGVTWRPVFRPVQCVPAASVVRAEVTPASVRHVGLRLVDGSLVDLGFQTSAHPERIASSLNAAIITRQGFSSR